MKLFRVTTTALVLAAVLAACGQQDANPVTNGGSSSVDQTSPVVPEGSRRFYFNPLTGEMFDESNVPLEPQGVSLKYCNFEIDWPHVSGTVVNSVKVNGTGSCAASSEAFYLTATMILEKQGFFPWSWTPVASGKPGTKLVSASGAKWHNQDINAYKACEMGAYRGRLQFSATYPGGGAIPIPLYDAVGWAQTVIC